MAQPDEILVVTATLGRSGWLAEAVESVAAVRASGLPVRHRIAAPAEALAGLRTRFPDCEVVESRAQGVYGALNEAVASAGPWSWMTWLNDDDRWEPGFEFVIRAALLSRDPSTAVVYGRVRYVSDAGVDLGPLPSAPPAAVSFTLASGRAAFSQQGALVSRAAWEKCDGFAAAYPLAADHDLWCRVAALGFSFRRVDTKAASFRLRPGQLSASRVEVAGEMARIRATHGAALARRGGRVAWCLHRLGSAAVPLERWWRAGAWTSEALYAGFSGALSGSLLVNPLLSDRPTGMGVAASGVHALIVPALARESTELDAAFRFINDRIPVGALRLVVRFALAQLVPFLFRGLRLVYTSHHAPVWRTGRHVAMVYDLIALSFPKQSRAQALYYRLVLPRVARCADRVVTISEAVRRELLGFLHEVPSQRVLVIPAYSQQLETIPESAGGTEEHGGAARPVLVVGARYRHKNLGLVLEAIDRLRADGNAPPLVIAGCRRDLWSGLPEWAALNRAGLLTVVDRPSDAELENLYRGALCLVYPSLAEGQGLPPLEALARGCPVICSDIPVLRETCGDSALYVDPHDAKSLCNAIERIRNGASAGDDSRRVEISRQTVGRFLAAALRPKWEALLGPHGRPTHGVSP